MKHFDELGPVFPSLPKIKKRYRWAVHGRLFALDRFKILFHLIWRPFLYSAGLIPTICLNTLLK